MSQKTLKVNGMLTVNVAGSWWTKNILCIKLNTTTCIHKILKF